MARVHVLQHVSFEGPGSIATWASENNHTLNITHLYKNDEFPSPEDIDLLVVMGGPMSVHDEKDLPWLKPEKAFIKDCIQHNKKILGICLGAQLLAEALGGTVFKNKEKEIGWLPIEITPAGLSRPLTSNLKRLEKIFHWHGETFTLPKNAVHIARSEACENQAFIFEDRILALQFHLEMTLEGASALNGVCGENLVPGTYVQNSLSFLSNDQPFEQCNRTMSQILNKFIS